LSEQGLFEHWPTLILSLYIPGWLTSGMLVSRLLICSAIGHESHTVTYFKKANSKKTESG